MWRAAVAAVAFALPAAADVPRGPASSPPDLLVPQWNRPLVPTGRFDVRTWQGAINTHTLRDESGRGAVPVSEARFLWGKDNLYVFFYAGDLDLQLRAKQHDGPVWNDDALHLEFPSSDGKKFVLDVSPAGVVADGVCPSAAIDLDDAGCDRKWESHARVGADFDGTPNTTGDFDEEWAVEIALPLASIGVRAPMAGKHVLFSLRRCEMAYDGRRACGYWGSAAAPGALVLDAPGAPAAM
jgi:hypothetical protein